MAIKEPGKKEMKTLMDLDPDDPRAAEIMAKICIPHAEGEAGKQKGVIPPWAVQYPKSENGVKPKSGDAALKKYREKLASGAPAFPVEMKDVQIGQNGPDDLDPLSLDDVEEKPVAAVKRKPRAKKEPQVDINAAIAQYVAATIANVEKAHKQAEVVEDVPARTDMDSRLSRFLAQKKRIAMKLGNGTIRMTVAAVIQDEFSITIILPIEGDGFTFTPDPDSKFTLAWDGKSVECYYPGTQFEIEALGLMGLVFLADTKQEVAARPVYPVRQPDGLVPYVAKQLPEEETKNVSFTTVDVKDNVVKEDKKYKYNPESGVMEDEFGLVKV